MSAQLKLDLIQKLIGKAEIPMLKRINKLLDSNDLNEASKSVRLYIKGAQSEDDIPNNLLNEFGKNARGDILDAVSLFFNSNDITVDNIKGTTDRINKISKSKKFDYKETKINCDENTIVFRDTRKTMALWVNFR